MKTIKYLIAALFAVATINVQAGPGGAAGAWPPTYESKRVTTHEQAMACCVPEAKVALACKDCKTATEKDGKDKKGILSWFKADSTHDCDGCKGVITVKQVGGGKVTDVQTKHVCSKCAADSAFTCSTHAK